MSFNSALSNPAFKTYDPRDDQTEEWSNFMQKVTEVSNLVKDLASADKNKAESASTIADKILQGKVITDDNIQLEIKSDRTVVNYKAFKKIDQEKKGEMDPETWMAEMSKDADRRYQDKKVRREKADTFKTKAVKAFRRGEYERALSCYNRAIEQINDNAMFYSDRALTNIKLGRFDKVFEDCDRAIRLNENSFKARLYLTKAYLELEDTEKYEQSLKELQEMFPQHNELTDYFLKKDMVEQGQ